MTGAPEEARAAGVELLREARFVPPYQLPTLVRQFAERLGCRDALMYLADLQQGTLMPFPPPGGPDSGARLEPLQVDATVAGRAFAHVEVLTQPTSDTQERVWIPLVDGAERLGVLQVVMAADEAPSSRSDLELLWDYAGVVASLVATKTLYGDAIVRLRRTGEMGLAAELQWSLLPPLTFGCDDVTVAAALEPAYRVAGDTVDYAVDSGRTRAAVFDGMGHGLGSAQLATVAIAAYRNARRGGLSLTATAAAIDEALLDGFRGRSYATGVLVELDTDTGRLHWISAGHPAPLLLREDRLVRPLQTAPALPLGMTVYGMDREPPAIGTEQLQPNDIVVLYSDGVVEARAPDGEFFGDQRLVDLIARNLAAGLPAPETLRRVIRALMTHQQGQLSDDATVLMLQWRSGNLHALDVTLPSPVAARGAHG